MSRPPTASVPTDPAHPRSGLARTIALGLCLLIASTCGALSVWQWQRLQWKQALLARIAALPQQAETAAPGPAAWPDVRRDSHEYAPLALDGHWEPAREQLVVASTVLGRGHWVMTPLRIERGAQGPWWIWVNRGFVDDAHRTPALRRPLPAGPVRVVGLLRASERPWLGTALPGMGQASRDVAALAAAAGLDTFRVAPYFVDLGRTDARQQAALAAAVEAGLPPPVAADAPWPRTGLTLLKLPNNHLSYALTWATLAAGALLAAGLVWRSGRPGQADASDDERPGR
ncbi:MAG: hypothetical protein RLY78_535 [Pseudomonadota bacterium]